MVTGRSGGKAYLSEPLDLPSRVLPWSVGNNLPGPESNHETPPAEEENSTVDIGEGIEDRNGSSFVVYWIDLGCLPQGSDLEAHGD